MVDWGWTDWIKIFGLGFLNDLAFTSIALVPAFLFHTFLTDDKYRKPYKWILWGGMTLLTAYILFFNDITDEYGGPMPRIVNAVLAFLWICLTIKMFFPKVRKGWRTAAIWIMMMLLLLLSVLPSSCF